MDRVKYSGKGADAAKKTGEVESLASPRQASRLAEVISAAQAILEDEGAVSLTISAASEPQQQPSERQYPRKQRMLTVSMRILVIATVILALFVFTSPLHLGRYSGVRYWADIILGISYIALGMSVIAVCVLIQARNSWL
ncbi:MAG: hypothetical protein ACYTE3_12055 [Planctomycetota bacterium]|jgi:hypothetical protein